MREPYKYTESGLDNVWLEMGAGVSVEERSSGKVLKIKDIEGLHRAIGEVLAKEKKDLNGKEIRFLRQEMLLSQASLAKLFGITEQTVHRWETGKADIPKPAEALIRSLYLSQLKVKEGGEFNIRISLERLADLEDELDGLHMAIAKKSWQLQREEKAA